MAEIKRIAKLFADLQHGDCWIGANFKETLHEVDSTLAIISLTSHSNNIWQLVSHLTYWRTCVINRLNGCMDLPSFNDLSLPEELTEEKWKQTIKDFENTYHQLSSTILHFKATNLDLPSPKPEQTYYQLIMGCLQHDAYHLGQIVLIKKSLERKVVI
jgi:uncharacterized damage-inducible protein DinB